MTEQTSTSVRRRPSVWADVVITLLLGAVFSLAYVGAGDWPFRTALFPRLIATAGVGICVVRLIVLGVRRTDRPDRRVDENGDVTKPAHELEDPGLVLRESSARSWMEIAAWLVGFFAALAVLGIFVTVPLFTAVYLVVSGRTRLWVAAVHAIAAGIVVYVLFSEILAVPMPEGILF